MSSGQDFVAFMQSIAGCLESDSVERSAQS